MYELHKLAARVLFYEQRQMHRLRWKITAREKQDAEENLEYFVHCSLTLILPRSRTGTVWFYTSTSNKRAARPKLYTESLTRDLKLMYSRFTLVRISLNLNSSQLNMFREIILPIFRKAGNIVGCALHHKL